MTEKIHSTAGYFLAGLAIGSLVGRGKRLSHTSNP